MEDTLRQSLQNVETDVDGALERFSGDEALYESLLQAFLTDPTMEMLQDAISRQAWDDAFTAAHALKGLAGNMGFVPLFHAMGELVIYIRTAKIKDVKDSLNQSLRCYKDLVCAIRQGNPVAM